MRKLTTQKVCDMARAFEGVTEKDHFGSDAFSANGRIFATVWHEKNHVNLMLNQEQQREFLAHDGEGFNPLTNAWGKNAINVELEFVDSKVFATALERAWENSANKRALPKKTKGVKPKKSAKKSRPTRNS